MNFFKNKKEQWFQRLFNNSHIAILIVDKNRKNLMINQRLCNMFGYEEKELINQSAEILHISNKSFLNFAQLAFDLVLEGKPVDITYQFKHQNGTLFWAHISGDIIESEKEVLWTLVDVTQQILFQNQLLAKEKHLLALNSLVGLGSWEYIIKSKKIMASDEIYNLLNLPLGTHLTLDDFIKITHPEDRELASSAINTLLSGGTTHGTNLRIYIEKNGHKELHYLFQKGMLVFDHSGKTISLIVAVLDFTEHKELKSELKENKELFKYKAYHDELTGLPNRALLLDRLTQKIHHSNRLGQKVAVIFIDLDDFKSINDALGHQIGDEYLIKISRIMKKHIRKSDTLSRLGGDEFGIVLAGIDNMPNLQLLLEHYIKIAETPIQIATEVIYPRMSIGVALYPDNGKTALELLKNADAAMYKAKNDGRHVYRFYDESMSIQAYQRIGLEKDLKNAIKHNELVVYYQPQIDAEQHKIIGMEALVRWQHPVKGLIPPGQFIPLAEETNLIRELNFWVMKTAILQHRLWHQSGKQAGVLALNIAVKQLECNDCFTKISNFLKEVNCKPQWIEIEVTEGQLMKSPEKVIEMLSKFHNLGIEIAIDDFGTGYSSLSYLKRFPIDKLKIDKSFIDNLPDDQDDVAITKTVIGLAKNLGLKVIAEGVENDKQKQFLIENGCKNIQGYYYSRPIPENEMTLFFDTF